MSFAEDLRRASEPRWTEATTHRFTVELGDDRLPDDVYRRYLVQDYAFLETLVSLVGYGVAKAEGMDAKIRLTRFLAAVTSDENTYFQRSFDALGVAAAERRNPPLHPVAAALIEELAAAGRDGIYADVLAVLLPAEWIYLTWAKAQAGRSPQRFYLREWIELHALPEFEAFVMWLKGELDRVGPGLDDVQRDRVARRFRRVVELEVQFFDAAYEAPAATRSSPAPKA